MVQLRRVATRCVATGILGSFILIGLFGFVSAQPEPTAFDTAAKKDAVDRVSTLLREHYVFAEIGANVATELKARLAAGTYAATDTPAAFARAVTDDLRRIANDRHLDLEFAPIGPMETPSRESPDEQTREAHRVRFRNYGFERSERMDGNVGYVKFDGFVHPTTEVLAAGAAAMNFVGGCDALILDLRENGGGNPQMVQFLESYLFPADPPTQLNSLYDRDENRIVQYWTLPYVPGHRLAEVPVYLLTSSGTFSAAEAFCYDLQARKRAVLVGGTTGGGANSGRVRRVNNLFTLVVPTGRVINPITNTNWEGVGIKPDIECPPGGALAVAHAQALKTLHAKATDPEDKRHYSWASVAADAAVDPVDMGEAELAALAGRFGPFTTCVVDGRLRCQKSGNAGWVLKPLTKTLFAVCGNPHLRMRFDNVDAATTRLVVLDEEGGEESLDRLE